MNPVIDGLVLLGLGLACLFVYGAFIEPRRIEISHHRLELAGWPAALDGFTILHLSDFHSRRRGPVEEFVAALADLLPMPDLIACTGDFAERPGWLEACLPVIAGLPARWGRWAVLGNNDVLTPELHAAVVEGLERCGVEVLDDRAARVEVDGGSFWLGGLAFVHLRQQDTRFAFPVAEVFAAAHEGPRILLTHSPDALPEALAAGVDLILAGHTHGGQICLPGGRPIENNCHRFRAPHYTRGVYRIGESVLFVSRGLGMTAPRLRTWCPPEVAVLHLHAGTPATP